MSPVYDPPLEIHGLLDAAGLVKHFTFNGQEFHVESLVRRWDDPRPDTPLTYHVYALAECVGCVIAHDRGADRWYLWELTFEPPRSR